jgi:flagellar basal body-associated protein FliL
MKKIIYIVAGLALFFVAGLIGLFLWFLAKSEFKKNLEQTAPARAARWAKKEVQPPQTEKTAESVNENLTLNQADEKKIDDLLDQIIKEKKNENQS